MELYELEEKIRTVFDKEESDQCFSQTFFNTSNSNLVATNTFDYPNSEALIELFRIIKNDDRLVSFFILLLTDFIVDSIEYPVVDERTEYMGYVNVSALSFYVLVRLGYVAEALDSLKRRFERSSLIYFLINNIIESGFFTEFNLKEILKKLDNEQKPPEPIEETLRKKLMKNLGF
jgi:hypothetical protein